MLQQNLNDIALNRNAKQQEKESKEMDKDQLIRKAASRMREIAKERAKTANNSRVKAQSDFF